MSPSRFSINVKQKEYRIPQVLVAVIAIVSNPGVRLFVFSTGPLGISLNIMDKAERHVKTLFNY